MAILSETNEQVLQDFLDRRREVYEASAPAIDNSLADAMDQLEEAEIDLALQQQEIEKMYYDRINDFLQGNLFDVPQETLDAITSHIETTYGPEYEALKARGIDMENLIKEQGIQALSQLAEIRAKSEQSFQLFTEDERQQLLDIAAASGRGPMDPELLREFATSLGREFTTLQAGLTAAERGIGDVTRQQLLTNARGIQGQEGILDALKAAAKAGQVFSMQTGLPAQIQAGAQAMQLGSSLDYQNMLNNSAIQKMIGGVTSPLISQRLAQPTTTQKTGYGILDTIGGILGGVGKIAGSFI